jgi:hypothetical protein
LKTNAKTSLKITMLPKGVANIDLTYSDLDSGHPLETSERIVLKLLDHPDYEWLFNLIQPYLYKKYCSKCTRIVPDKYCEYEIGDPPFPYCFKNKSE